MGYELHIEMKGVSEEKWLYQFIDIAGILGGIGRKISGDGIGGIRDGIGEVMGEMGRGEGQSMEFSHTREDSYGEEVCAQCRAEEK